MKHILFFFLTILSITVNATTYDFEAFILAQNSTSVDTETTGLGVGFNLNLTDNFTINTFVTSSDANVRGVGAIYSLGRFGLGASTILHRMQTNSNNGYMYFIEYKAKSIFARVGILDIKHNFSSNICNVGPSGNCVSTDVVITNNHENNPFVMIGVKF